MIRPLLALELLTFLEPEGKVGYRCGQNDAERETMDYLEFIARVTSLIPDKGRVMVRFTRSGSLSSFSRFERISCPDMDFGRGFRGY